MDDSAVSVFVMMAVLFASYLMGFYLIYQLEKKGIYNLFAAILMPCMAMLSLWIILALVFNYLAYLLLFLFPFLLIASSIGGIVAHRKRKKQHASD